jgi:hypothetical protein
MNSKAKKRHKQVSRGMCGWCGKKRNKFAWLCDNCAAIHREKQRVKKHDYAQRKREREAEQTERETKRAEREKQNESVARRNDLLKFLEKQGRTIVQ